MSTCGSAADMKAPSGDTEGSSFLNYTPLTAAMTGSNGAPLTGAIDEETGVPDLGADMAAIRARVLGRRTAEAAAAALLTADEHREVYDGLKTVHQVDLNIEANALALEDPTLIAHMESARRRLAEQEKALLRLPRREALRTSYLDVMGKVSTLIRKLEDEHQAARENVERGFRQARVLGELAAGRKPHGYPAFGAAAVSDRGAREAMGIASKKAGEVAKSYEDVLAVVDAAKTTLFVLRRDFEAVGDGLLELIEACEEDRRRLREFLEIAARTKAVSNASAGPASSLGERLLNSSAIPEESGIIDGAQGE